MIGEQADRGAEAGRRRPIAFIARIRRRSRWVVLATLAAFIASIAYVAAVRPAYRSVAEVVLQEAADDSARLDNARGGETAAATDETTISAQASAELARRVIERLGLAAEPEFAGSGDQGALEAFLSRLTLSRARGSNVVRIEFVSHDPVLAARCANAVAETYVEARKEESQRARTGAELASRKLEELERRAADADAKVAAAQAEQVPRSGATDEAALAEQVSDLETQLANVRSAEAAATAKADLLRKLSLEGRLDEAPASVADESVRRLVGERATLRAEIADASRTYLPLHPRMKDLSSQLAALDSQLRDAAAKNQRTLDNDAQLAKDQVASLSATLVEQREAAAAARADEGRLQALVAEAADARRELDSHQQRSRDALAREAAAPDEARIIAAAQPQRGLAYLNLWKTVFLATLAGFALSSAVAAAAPLVDPRQHDARSEIGAPPPVVAAVATGTGDRPAWAAQGAPDTDVAALEEGERSADHSFPAGMLDSPDALAARLTRSTTSDDFILLIAGNGSGQALATALETARRLSLERPTLLVDLGATQDWFADILDREDSNRIEVPGLADLLAGRASFSEVIQRDLSSSLDVIPSGGVIDRDALDMVFAALASSYPRIVFHASDWRAEPAGAAAEIADAVVIVAPAARLRRALEESRRAHRTCGSPSATDSRRGGLNGRCPSTREGRGENGCSAADQEYFPGGRSVNDAGPACFSVTRFERKTVIFYRDWNVVENKRIARSDRHVLGHDRLQPRRAEAAASSVRRRIAEALVWRHSAGATEAAKATELLMTRYAPEAPVETGAGEKRVSVGDSRSGRRSPRKSRRALDSLVEKVRLSANLLSSERIPSKERLLVRQLAQPRPDVAVSAVKRNIRNHERSLHP